MSDFAGTGPSAEKRSVREKRAAEIAGTIAAWVWFSLAGLGGLMLIIKTGPWPPTHGWFAMFSGLSACPLIAWASKKYLAITLSGLVRFVAAAMFFVAGHLALIFIWPR